MITWWTSCLAPMRIIDNLPDYSSNLCLPTLGGAWITLVILKLFKCKCNSLEINLKTI